MLTPFPLIDPYRQVFPISLVLQAVFRGQDENEPVLRAIVEQLYLLLAAEFGDKVVSRSVNRPNPLTSRLDITGWLRLAFGLAGIERASSVVDPAGHRW